MVACKTVNEYHSNQLKLIYDENDALQNTSKELVEGDQLDNNETEEHEGGPPSAISNIHPRDFYNSSEF